MKHTGLVMMWLTQRYTFTGTYDQCEAAVRDAQTHCLAAGWWSIASLLVINWIALCTNANAHKTLREHAAQQHPYATYPPLATRPPAWSTPCRW